MKKILMIVLFVTVCIPVIASAQGGCPGNLIVNGSFENGNTGFASDYVYTPPGMRMWDPKSYGVGINPRMYHDLWAIYGDHTTGSGNMMIVNATSADGDGTPGSVTETVPYDDRVWEQIVSVTPNTTYVFSYWVALSYISAPPLLQVSINGQAIGTYDALTVPETPTGAWVQVSHAWFSGSATSATIKIVDQRPVYIGDDYALDDLCFSVQAACVQTNLIAGRKTVVGDISVQADGTNLYATFTVDNPWCFTKLYFDVAANASDIPQNRTIPVVGKFGYKYLPEVGTLTCGNEYTFIIPLSDLPESGVMVAHASVQRPLKNGSVQYDSAWGQGSSFSGRNWAMYFDYDLNRCMP